MTCCSSYQYVMQWLYLATTLAELFHPNKIYTWFYYTQTVHLDYAHRRTTQA